MTRSSAAQAKAPARRQVRTDGATAQEQLLDAAQALFYREGVRAVGVDAVVERAGVNKMSLYRRFASKDELVVAYLERMDDRFRQRLEASFEKHPGEPEKQLVQAFDDLVERASAPDYRGCPFVNVSCEFGDPAHPARQLVERNKRYVMTRFIELCRAAGAQRPVELAESLALLLDGVYATSQTYGPGSGPLRAASRVARTLVEAACMGSTACQGNQENS
ncbi:TetR/AcrR family transcriptional regulator [Caballeronia sp. LZ062]|uniref:TetR/AcrR family transcriptional regulator n=1 Tax=unclassified Caballeronia TaxID=2646786 RepID=UPI00285F486C|nr:MULTISPECIES: TetR/AcrR family transcriptional regulator [unclassified Caballeronia]MDR5855539.1 TetR/AcrR family transcriptional regulator [Caballeronia sp. LZ050]MDR5869935.1 TetR/AcrR family transcriptional regulator [Caballeronia sp. LZ062]